MSDNVEPKEEYLAFPLTFDHPQSNQRYVHTGMTLRDYFAAKAMQSILTHQQVMSGLNVDMASTVPAIAFRIADIMMKVRDESE